MSKLVLFPVPIHYTLSLGLGLPTHRNLGGTVPVSYAALVSSHLLKDSTFQPIGLHDPPSILTPTSLPSASLKAYKGRSSSYPKSGTLHNPNQKINSRFPSYKVLVPIRRSLPGLWWLGSVGCQWCHITEAQFRGFASLQCEGSIFCHRWGDAVWELYLKIKPVEVIKII